MKRFTEEQYARVGKDMWAMTRSGEIVTNLRRSLGGKFWGFIPRCPFFDEWDSDGVSHTYPGEGDLYLVERYKRKYAVIVDGRIQDIGGCQLFNSVREIEDATGMSADDLEINMIIINC